MVLTKEGYRPRLIDPHIERMLKTFGAICIEGPKWCGKTWTSFNHAESFFNVGDKSRNFQNRTLALMDPNSVLEGDAPHLIDEWQEAPALWDAVRGAVDESPIKGRYILTGSSTPRFKGILHSGEGRIGSVRMRTMSLFESGDSDGKVSLADILNGGAKTVKGKETTLDELIDLSIRGGWPAAIGLEPENYGMIPTDYIDKAISSAVRLDGKSRSHSKMTMLIKSLARNVSTLASKKTLVKDIKEYEGEQIADNTITEYLDCLERLFIIDNQNAFSTNIRSSVRIGKSPKRHFVDPSLAVAALGLNHEKIKNDLRTFGFIFESMCVRDLRIYAEADGAKIFHYHDEKDNEVDAIIEDKNGDWSAFEIKLGANEIDNAAKNLLKIKNKFSDSEKPPKNLCVVCGLSSAAYMRDDGVFVVPLTSLRN